MTHTSRTGQDTTADAIRQQLEQLLQERLDILAELAPRALPTVDPVAYQTAASNRKVVEQITAALNRLDAGTYGGCTRCGRQITPARLEALPHAAACIDCQSHADAA
ncbi:TraR/DksA C4-type zinc finger protein [Microbacterium sp. SS28]|uniref:TraR/DksA family transcriptional regulator n=1 Tax=Microbacterium sp. SS28 TaxID=2919948 RepID=UPI001FAA930F|nr:TraR/DksA C4-type zinc finger protein [Microbacterium sp. SS28]